MIRLLLRLFNVRDYDTCKSCQTLKEQLDYERSEKIRLTDTLLNILQPKTIDTPPIELNPIQQTSALFSRRRAALEEQDRINAKILAEKKHLGVPDDTSKKDDSILKLEQELGIQETEVKH